MRDADGYFTYVGRADDRVQSLRLPDQPVRARKRLDRAPGGRRSRGRPRPPIRCASRSRKPSSRWRRTIRPTATRRSSIFRHLRAHLAPYKRVRRLEFADLPKTISGKIRRVELRTAEAARGGENRRAEGEFWEEDFPELR